MPAVRNASRSELDGIAHVLARAFRDEPVTCWVFPAERRRVGRSARFFRARAHGLFPQGELYTTHDLAGAALWALPNRWRATPEEILRLLPLALALGRRVPEVLRGFDRIERAHPAEPHYYLAVLGTEPERQGEGIGSALMAPVLAECDRDEIPAYLETATERNIDFYARHGFRVTGEVRMPNGPPVWLMWRDPRP